MDEIFVCLPVNNQLGKHTSQRNKPGAFSVTVTAFYIRIFLTSALVEVGGQFHAPAA
jgi:hypothetical protein